MYFKNKKPQLSLFHYITIVVVAFIFAVLLLSERQQEQKKIRKDFSATIEEVQQEFQKEALNGSEPQRNATQVSMSEMIEQPKQEERSDYEQRELSKQEQIEKQDEEEADESRIALFSPSPEIGELLKRQWRGQAVSPSLGKEQSAQRKISPVYKSVKKQSQYNQLTLNKGFFMGGCCLQPYQRAMNGKRTNNNLIVMWLSNDKSTGTFVLPNVIRCDYQFNRAQCWLIPGSLWGGRVNPEYLSEPIASVHIAKIKDETYDDIDAADLGTIDFLAKRIIGSDPDTFLQSGSVLVIKFEENRYAKVNVLQCVNADDTFLNLDAMGQPWQHYGGDQSQWKYLYIQIEWEYVH